MGFQIGQARPRTPVGKRQIPRAKRHRSSSSLHLDGAVFRAGRVVTTGNVSIGLPDDRAMARAVRGFPDRKDVPRRDYVVCVRVLGDKPYIHTFHRAVDAERFVMTLPAGGWNVFFQRHDEPIPGV